MQHLRLKMIRLRAEIVVVCLYQNTEVKKSRNLSLDSY